MSEVMPQGLVNAQREFYIAFRKLEHEYKRNGMDVYRVVADAIYKDDMSHTMRFKENKVRTVLLEAAMMNLDEEFVNDVELPHG